MLRLVSYITIYVVTESHIKVNRMKSSNDQCTQSLQLDVLQASRPDFLQCKKRQLVQELKDKQLPPLLSWFVRFEHLFIITSLLNKEDDNSFFPSYQMLKCTWKKCLLIKHLIMTSQEHQTPDYKMLGKSQ